MSATAQYGGVATGTARPGRINGFSPPFTSKQLGFCCANVLSFLFFVTVCLVFQHLKEAEVVVPHDGWFKGLFLTHLVIAAVGFACWLFVELHNPSKESCFSSLVPDTKRWTEFKWCREHKAKLQGLDHYCQWLNVSIARSNYVPFFVLTSCGTVQYILQTVLGVLMLTLWRDALLAKGATSSDPDAVLLQLAVLVNVGNSVCLGFSFGMLVYFHVHLLQLGMSTYTYLIDQRKKHLATTQQAKRRAPSGGGGEGELEMTASSERAPLDP